MNKINMFNIKNLDLEKMNLLTRFIAGEILGYMPGKGEIMLDKTFIVSTTDFSYEEYEDIPFRFLKDMGFTREEWERVHKVKIIRSVIMSPYLTPDYVDENYVKKFLEYLKKEIIDNSKQILGIY